MRLYLFITYFQALYICCVPSSSGVNCVVCDEVASDPHPTAARPPSAHSSLPMRCQRPRRGRPASWNGLSLWCFSVLAGREKAVTWSECCTAVAAATPRGVAGKGKRTVQANAKTWGLPMLPQADSNYPRSHKKPYPPLVTTTALNWPSTTL